MALGNNGNQNRSTTLYEPSYYSRLRFTNYDDKLALGFTFWKGALKISISESGSANEGRNNELAYIHLSPMKARIFAGAVQKMIDDPESFEIYGIDTGSGDTSGFIAIGRDMGKPYIVLAKVDSAGKYVQYQKFNFPFDTNYSLKIENLTNLQFTKEINNTVDIEALKDLMEDYARSSSGAYGASYYDIGRYEIGKESNLTRKIAIKLGVLNQDGGYADSTYHKSGSNNSFFSGNGNSKQEKSYQSIDDLEDELG